MYRCGFQQDIRTRTVRTWFTQSKCQKAKLVLSICAMCIYLVYCHIFVRVPYAPITSVKINGNLIYIIDKYMCIYLVYCNIFVRVPYAPITSVRIKGDLIYIKG